MASTHKANNGWGYVVTHESYSSFNLRLKKVCSIAFMWKKLVLVIALSIPVTSVVSAPISRAADPIPEYTELLRSCSVANTGEPCYVTEFLSDAVNVAMFPECVGAVTNYCYIATVDDKPAPSTLKFVVRLTSWKTYDPSYGNPQYSFDINAFYVPPSRTFEKLSNFGWSMKPQNQSATGGLVDLSAILSKSSNIKVEIRYKMSKMPQVSVVVADQGKMDFKLTGQDLVTVIEGHPAQVALESDAQHINYFTERSEDTSLAWTNRCGIPSLKFVVCNVNKAESAPLVFYARSFSSWVNSPFADVPGPIWVSTNATYFQFPSLVVNGETRQLEIKTTAPHFLPDGTTLNTGSFTAFLPNKLLEKWGITKTEAGLNSTLATSIKKEDVESVVERSFTISEAGATIVFPSIGYSSPVVTLTAVTGSGSQSANQVYSQLLAGAKVGGNTGTATTIPAATTSNKSVRKGSSTYLISLIKTVGKGFPTWKATGLCKIVRGKLVAPTKAATCTLTLNQAKYKTTPKRTKKITIKVK